MPTGPAPIDSVKQRDAQVSLGFNKNRDTTPARTAKGYRALSKDRCAALDLSFAC